MKWKKQSAPPFSKPTQIETNCPPELVSFQRVCNTMDTNDSSEDYAAFLKSKDSSPGIDLAILRGSFGKFVAFFVKTFLCKIKVS